MRALFFLLFLLLTGSQDVRGNFRIYEQALQILTKLHSRAALHVISNSTGHETQYQTNVKRTEINPKNLMNENDDVGEYKRNFDLDSVLYTTNSYKFPVDNYIKQAMLAILGEDGILEKGGFYLDGYIKNDGTAFIKMSKGFGNRTNLIHEIQKARKSPDVSTPLAVIVHLLITSKDTDNLLDWQREQIYKGNLKQEDPCAPKMVVMYKCCTPTVLKLIGPLFGTLRIATD